MAGWVGWLIADAFPTKWSNGHPLVQRKVLRPRFFHLCFLLVLLVTRCSGAMERRTAAFCDLWVQCQQHRGYIKATEWPTSFFYLSPQCLRWHNCPWSHSSQEWRLKRGLRLFVTSTSHDAEHTVEHSHKMSAYQHSLEFTKYASLYVRIIVRDETYRPT